MSMERLWAPWRMEFIRNVEETQGCFLCAAAEATDDHEGHVVRRGNTCLCLLNLYPYNNGHLLIAPFRHEGALEALTAEERNEIMAMTVEAKLTLDKAVGAQGYNVGVNLGRVAGAGLEEHFHLHVVPRWSGDTNFITTVGSTKVIPEALESMWSLLSKEWICAES